MMSPKLYLWHQIVSSGIVTLSSSQFTLLSISEKSGLNIIQSLASPVLSLVFFLSPNVFKKITSLWNKNGQIIGTIFLF